MRPGFSPTHAPARLRGSDAHSVTRPPLRRVPDDFAFRQDLMTFNHRGRVVGLLLETAGLRQQAAAKKKN